MNLQSSDQYHFKGYDKGVMISISVIADKYSRNVLSVLYMQISFIQYMIDVCISLCYLELRKHNNKTFSSVNALSEHMPMQQKIKFPINIYTRVKSLEPTAFSLFQHNQFELFHFCLAFDYCFYDRNNINHVRFLCLDKFLNNHTTQAYHALSTD